ncbi:MAG: hypothetical protein WD894_01300 [Pirellulales bacterium]
MSARNLAWLLAPFAASLALSRATMAQDEAPRNETQVDRLRKKLEESVGWHQFQRPKDKKPLKPHIVLRWDNNVSGRNSAVGLTVVWADDIRPQVIASIYPLRGILEHEIDLLSREPNLIGKREGRLLWQPKETGIEFHAVPEAPPPAQTIARRRLQLKQLALQFEATMLGFNPDNSDRQELRMMPQWLYRYGREGTECLDGAIFSFAMGTDPEAVLLLEAFKTNDDAYQWQFAFVRQTSAALEGRWKKDVVWSAERTPIDVNPALPHRTLRESLPPKLLESER